jgi:hypothetical protein
MVRVRAENGSYYHEPPYTDAEEMALYKAASARGGLTILHGPPAASPQPLPSAPQQPARKPRRS